MTDVMNLLKKEGNSAGNIKDPVNRKSVIDALESTKECLKHYRGKTPPNGLMVFCGAVKTEKGKSEYIAEHFSPPKPIHSSLYECGKVFNVKPLETMLDDNESFGFIVVDGQGCLFGLVAGDHQTVLRNYKIDLPNKHKKGGSSSNRYQNGTENTRNFYLRSVGEDATAAFIAEDVVTVDALIVAGCADMKHKLMVELDPRLAKLVLGAVDVRSSNEAGFTEAVRLSSALRTEYRTNQDRMILTAFFKELELNTNKAVWGANETMKALSLDLVSDIVVTDRCALHHYLLRNTVTNSTIIKVATETQAAHPSFTVDSHETKWEIVEDVLLCEWLTGDSVGAGVQLHFVSDHTSEGSRFSSGGGVGCLLRYAVDGAALDCDDHN